MIHGSSTDRTSDLQAFSYVILKVEEIWILTTSPTFDMISEEAKHMSLSAVLQNTVWNW